MTNPKPKIDWPACVFLLLCGAGFWAAIAIGVATALGLVRG